MKLPRSSYYYTPTVSVWKEKQDADLWDRIEQIVVSLLAMNTAE